jgi:glycine/D-amino acid oxidase-like deaminating enzyme
MLMLLLLVPVLQVLLLHIYYPKPIKKIIILEKDGVGQGATGYTTAFLTQAIDSDYSQLISDFGKATSKKILESHGAAIDIIEHIVKTEKIDCEFVRCSNYNYANTDDEFESLKEEEQALKSLKANVALKKEGKLGIKQSGFLEYKNQAKFHPTKYVSSLAKIVTDKGVKIFDHSEVLEISEDNDKNPIVKTTEYQITTKKVVIGTHNPFNKPVRIHFKKGQYTTYVYEVHFPKDTLAEGLYEDQMSPYHYFRIDKCKTYDRMIIGGEDHRQDIPVDPEKSFQALSDYLISIVPNFNFQIKRQWTGPIVEPIDGLAFIGPHSNHPNQLYATGFSGTGMTYGTIAAKIIADLITGHKNKWLKLYDIQRIPTLKQLARKGLDYSEELIGGAIKNTLSYSSK